MTISTQTSQPSTSGSSKKLKTSWRGSEGNGFRIALSGPIGAGKTEIAKLLVEHHNFTRVGFADVLKDEASAVFGVPRDCFDGPDKESVRYILIQYGMLWRQIDPKHWVKALENRLWDVFIEEGSVVVDDLRFPDEAEMLKKHGFFHIRLQPTYHRSYTYLTDIKGLSMSEAAARMDDVSESSLGSVVPDLLYSPAEDPHYIYADISKKLVHRV